MSRIWNWLYVKWPFRFGEHFLWKRTVKARWQYPRVNTEREYETGVEDPHLWKTLR